MSKRLDNKGFIEKSISKFGLKFDYSLVKYINNHTKVKIICPIHGEFEITPNSHLCSKWGCGDCGREAKHKNKTYSLEDMILRANKVHNSKYNYSKSTYKGIYSKAIIICPTHGEFKQRWNDHVNNKHGCSKCKVELSKVKKRNIHKVDFIQKLPPTIQIIGEYKNSHTPTKFSCAYHGEFISKPYYINENINLCSKCSNLSGTSHLEQSLVDFIQKLKLKFQTNYKDLHGVSEVDVYIPSKKLAIEFNGLYWHSDKFKDATYHLEKTKACNSLGIQLIHIFEDEWVNKRHIVESRLRSILGKISKNLYARQTSVREVNWSTSKIFLEENHIQGAGSPSKINLGLYKDGELVSLMTFGAKRKVLGNKNIKGEYELLRFCNKLNNNVVGGASKLLKYFEKEYTPKSIISYADLRWSKGNLYTKLEFQHTSTSKPNYYYIKSELREYRYKYAKHKLVKQGFDINKTEKEIMEDRGYFRIYDCGNLKFIKNFC